MAPRASRRSTVAMQLNHAAAMKLLEFVCAFAWADLKVRQAERDLVMRIVGRLGLSHRDAEQVKAWLEVAPDEDDIDPSTIPREHRELFLQLAAAVVESDGQVAPVERDALELFRGLMEL